MKTLKNAARFLIILSVAFFIEAMGGLQLFSTAEAIIGRPLTPVSVAGAARRTVRRCAYGVYYCQIKTQSPVKTIVAR